MSARVTDKDGVLAIVLQLDFFILFSHQSLCFC